MSCTATFHGGPADGKTLSFNRIPRFLRVVYGGFKVNDPNGGWDVLDQLEDEPEPSEEIHVYRGEGEPKPIFMCRGPGSGMAYLVDYHHVPEVDGEEVRATDAWREKVEELATEAARG